MRTKFLSRGNPVRALPVVAVLFLVAVLAAASAPFLRAGLTPPPAAPSIAPAPTPAPAPEPVQNTGPVVRDGTAAEAGLNPDPITAAQRRIAAWTQPSPGHPHPLYAGEVSVLARNGIVVSRQAAGDAVRYRDGQGSELPPQQRQPVRPDTIFDIASLTKLFTSISVLQLVEDGRVRLDAPVADYVPEFAAGGKRNITVQQLLTHTSGLQAKIELWRLPQQDRLSAVLGAVPQNAPGTVYQYSDLNMITLGVLVQRVSGTSLDHAVHDRITGPLGMDNTGFRPAQDKRERIAATEFQTDPPRGMVRGDVEDENTWVLGGVAGQAGIFSTADDLVVLGQTILNGGTYRGHRVLRPETVHAMLTNHTSAFPGNAHGLGFELDQRWYMAGLSGPGTAGHTGFTGTSLVIDPASGSIVVLLTNSVHPSRNWGSINQARRELAQGAADALGRTRSGG